MLNLKPITSVFFALLSNVAIAGSMGPSCVADDVTTPCVRSGWDFGVQALYLRPSYSSALSWVGVNTTSSTTYLSTIGVESNPKWGWGFKLEGAYHFSSGNDLNLNWYHLGSETTTRISNVTGFDPGSPIITQLKPRWDAVNLEFGQQLNFGEIKNTRIHAGLQVANISNKVSMVGSGLNSTQDSYTYNQEVHAKYTGVGPRIGTDMFFGILPGLNIYGQGAVSALAGRSTLTQTYADSLATGVFPPRRTTNANTVVPELEAKLGLKYRYALNHGNVEVDAGYLWVNYFNALFAAAHNRPVDNNFSVNGPYLGLKWLGTAV